MTRTLLVLACLAAILLCFAGMWLGWRNRGRRQADLPPLPSLPHRLSDPRLAPLSGIYIGTTYARSWQDRVVARGLGLRATASVTLHDEGLLIEREGAEPVFLPLGDVLSARLEPALAGKVVGEGGLMVINWRLGETELDTGLRADDKTEYPQWVRAINERAMV
ncbi:hypothetical protein SAMN05892883_2944 [Jatrophihabitans sp. GAS493]|uniref:PH-like domain-containing protein n=1 Tax=Jatrophihabitans sp. GAS493 TaxID=1907575 RepID=UPI000BB6F297|nr:transporter [Jatrophihabitans sp. GAS493]SOD73684.1 hypothetical protein SAMN05892883_2944 [Jatrophihabitans sp. GAS493]